MKMGHPDVALLRIDKGADVNKHDHIGSTPLRLASLEGLLGVARLLVEADADVFAEDSVGRVARDLSETKNLRELLALAEAKSRLLTFALAS